MKTKQLYFDSAQLEQGNFFNLYSEIQTEEGHFYELEDWIDRGGNATVYQCRHRVTGEEYAIKFLINIRFNNTKRFFREVKLLQSITGDHITKYYGTGRVTVRHNKYDESRKLPFVVMELAERNLQDVLRDQANPLSYEQYAGQFRGLARALSTLHDLAVHRDIKPENILVAGERWLLSDYGLCTFVNPDEEDLTPAMEGQNIGPKFWLSPEAHNRRLAVCRTWLPGFCLQIITQAFSSRHGVIMRNLHILLLTRGVFRPYATPRRPGRRPLLSLRPTSGCVTACSCTPGPITATLPSPSHGRAGETAGTPWRVS